MKTIYIVRHCKAAGQAADAALTDTGLEQAERLAAFFFDKQVDYIVSSPYVRAYRTIEPLAAKLGLRIVSDDRLTERVLSGNNHPEWRDMLRKTYDDLDLCYEGGESSKSAMSRIVSVATETLNGRYDKAVVVSHGNLISLLLKYYDDRFGFNEWAALSNPDVYRLSFASDLPDIERIWTEGQ